jgi:hypothetical protein
VAVVDERPLGSARRLTGSPRVPTVPACSRILTQDASGSEPSQSRGDGEPSCGLGRPSRHLGQAIHRGQVSHFAMRTADAVVSHVEREGPHATQRLLFRYILTSCTSQCMN